MKTKLILLTAGFQIALLGSLMSQQEVSLERPMAGAYDADIPENVLDSIVRLTEEALSIYAEVAHLKSIEEARTEEEIVERFKIPFSAKTAILMKDYEMFPGSDLVGIDEYCREVMYYFPSGFDFAIGDPSDLEIRNDGDDWYKVSLKLPKNMFSIVRDQQPLQKPDGLPRLQNFVFQVNKGRMDKAEITKISNASATGPAEDFTDIISIFGAVGTGSYSVETSDFWNANHPESTLESRGGLNYSFGAEFITNRLVNSKGSSDKDFFISAGVMFSAFSINTELGSYRNSYDELASNETGSQLYLRLVELETVDEEMNINTFQVPLGFGYRVIDDRDYFVQAFIKVIPGFVIGGTSTVTGNSIYDGIFYLPDNSTLSDFRILDETATNQATQSNPDNFGPFNVGEQDIDLESEPDFTSTFLTLQFSPTAHFKFDNRSSVWGLSVGLDVGYQFSSLLEHNPITNREESPLGTIDDFEGSLLNYFANDANGLVFGLRVGLSHFSMNSPR